MSCGHIITHRFRIPIQWIQNKERLSNVKITDIPSANVVDGLLKVGDSTLEKHSTITYGKSLTERGPGKMVFKFQTNGLDPVELTFTNPGDGYVWLNALIIKQFIP